LQEWADYISFLGRLLKSLQARPVSITTVPSKSIVAKRLAQCLNPALPSGVHQKTLEVYSYIFSMIGKDTLSRDLPLYLPGISSTLSFASLSVRGPFLELFEAHLLQVDKKALRPALKAIILALLPGLEEETSEEYDRTLRLLDSFKVAIRPSWSEDLDNGHATGDEYFWQCFFLASITGTNRRLGSLAYLTRNFPRLAGLSADDSTSHLANIVTSPESGLLIRSFAAGLSDEHVLIQRGFQDLLLTHLPLHSEVLQKRVKTADLELLLNAAASIVVRREMSLNRRLWSWLLGPSPTTDPSEETPTSPNTPGSIQNGVHHFSSTRYFEDFGLRPLTRALLQSITSDMSSAVDRARPFRICLSLMDRWEIGGLVVPDIFLPIVESVRKYKTSGASRQDFAEVLKSASVFFDGVESGLIWGEILALFTQTLNDTTVSIDDRLDRLSVITFIINHFNVKEEEMVLVHVPLVVVDALAMLGESQSKNARSWNVQQSVLDLIVTLLESVPERAFQLRRQDENKSATVTTSATGHTSLSNVEIDQRIQKFYSNDQGNLDTSPSPFLPHEMAVLILREASRLFTDSLLTNEPSTALTLKIKLLVLVLAKVPSVGVQQVEDTLSAITKRLEQSGNVSFHVLSSIITLITTLSARGLIALASVHNLVEPIVRLAWSHLSTASPKHHVESIRALWQIQYALPSDDRSVEAALSMIITENRRGGVFSSQDQLPGQAFAILWTHSMLENSMPGDRQSLKSPLPRAMQAEQQSQQHTYEVMLDRPLFLMLDALTDEQTQLSAVVKAWLHSLSFSERYMSRISCLSVLSNNQSLTGFLIYLLGNSER
jgi:hypothetical protein